MNSIFQPLKCAFGAHDWCYRYDQNDWRLGIGPHRPSWFECTCCGKIVDESFNEFHWKRYTGEFPPEKYIGVGIIKLIIYPVIFALLILPLLLALGS